MLQRTSQLSGKKQIYSSVNENDQVHLHLQDTSKLQYVEDFLEGMLGKQNFEITYIHLRINIFFFFYKIKTT